MKRRKRLGDEPNMPPGDSGKALLRILVRSPNWLGDAVMSFPAVEALQRAFPRARIDALAPQNLAVLWEQHPAVASVVRLDPKASPRKTGQALRSRGYDLGILFPNSFRSALELWWARAPMRVGYAGQWRRTLLTHPVERGPDWFPTRPLSEKQAAELVQNAKSPNRRAKPPSGAHHVFQYLRLAAALGADVKPAPPRLTLSEGQVRAALRKLNLPLEPEPPWVALHPGAAYGEAKQWFPDRFLETAALVHKQRPCRWLIIGGEEERSLTRWLSTKLAQTLASRPSRPGAVAVHEPVIHLGGKTS
ncbi:MAG: hypothetical protein J7M29_01880, partial [Verrucomicrobia bacterium]|nr:hypothetical protein [Verrucomicrobiota bacterium]